MLITLVKAPCKSPCSFGETLDEITDCNAGPALQSVISSKVSPKEQGDLQGALTSVISITSIIGPLLMTQIFYFFTHPDAKIKLLTLELKPPFQFSGAPFFLGFVLMAVSAYFVYYVFHRKK